MTDTVAGLDIYVQYTFVFTICGGNYYPDRSK